MNLLGIDLGTRKIAAACFVRGAMVGAHSYESPEETPRALQLHELALMVENMAALYDIDSAWIEDTLVGNNRKYSMRLAEVKGAVMSALHKHDVRTVDNGTWKKQVVGNGHASKDEIRDYIHVTHGAYAPLCGDDQDRYDATCIGLYGLLICKRAEDLQLESG